MQALGLFEWIYVASVLYVAFSLCESIVEMLCSSRKVGIRYPLGIMMFIIIFIPYVNSVVAVWLLLARRRSA